MSAEETDPAAVNESEETKLNDEEAKDEEADSNKRPREEEDEEAEEIAKKVKADEEKPEPEPVPASKEGLSFFNDNDVLSGKWCFTLKVDVYQPEEWHCHSLVYDSLGRGGGTNVHPGNRNFRDLINLHRRAYLKARKNDKPAISRAIVRSIRETTGRFLKKDDKTGLWFEIGDDAAREKTSQALRQRAPEMRKLLFDTEREEARAAAEEHMRQQRIMMGLPPDAPVGTMPPGFPMMPPGMQMPPGANPMFNPAIFMAAAANGMKPPGGAPGAPGIDPYQQMFQAALMGGGAPNRFAVSNSNGPSGGPAAAPPAADSKEAGSEAVADSAGAEAV